MSQHGKHVPKHRQPPSRLASRTALRTLFVLSTVAVAGTGTAVAGGTLALSPGTAGVAVDVAATTLTPTAQTPPAPSPAPATNAASAASAASAAKDEPRTDTERREVVSRSDRRGVADPLKRASLSLDGDNLFDRTEDSSDEDPRTVAATLVGDSGQFDCLDSLWAKESGWSVYADNPSSSAYGIPQALPGSKMSSFGADWATNPVTQIRWGLDYIEDRYGSPCSAWGHSQSVGWY